MRHWIKDIFRLKPRCTPIELWTIHKEYISVGSPDPVKDKGHEIVCKMRSGKSCVYSLDSFERSQSDWYILWYFPNRWASKIEMKTLPTYHDRQVFED